MSADATFKEAAARGLILSTLMQMASESWSACFVKPDKQSFMYGYGKDAATALREALRKHDARAPAAQPATAAEPFFE